MTKRTRSRRSPLAAAAAAVAERERRDVGTSTPERIVKSGSAIDVDPAGRQRVAMAILDRLHARKQIDGAMFLAGDRLREDAYIAGLVPSGSVPMEPVDGRRGNGNVPAFMATERASDAARRYRAALQAVGQRLSPVLCAVLWPSSGDSSLADVGARLFNREPGNASAAAALETLKIALAQLDEHYHPEGKNGRPRLVGWRA